jgi:hypothetical protein
MMSGKGIRLSRRKKKDDWMDGELLLQPKS